MNKTFLIIFVVLLFCLIGCKSQNIASTNNTFTTTKTHYIFTYTSHPLDYYLDSPEGQAMIYGKLSLVVDIKLARKNNLTLLNYYLSIGKKIPEGSKEWYEEEHINNLYEKYYNDLLSYDSKYSEIINDFENFDATLSFDPDVFFGYYGGAKLRHVDYIEYQEYLGYGPDITNEYKKMDIEWYDMNHLHVFYGDLFKKYLYNMIENGIDDPFSGMLYPDIICARESNMTLLEYYTNVIGITFNNSQLSWFNEENIDNIFEEISEIINTYK